MAGTSTITTEDEDSTGLKRSITGKQLFFYTLGDVLGSGIYVLIGLVAAAVGGAFWIAFAIGVSIAAITGSAYAELVTKYPQAAGAALYVNKAFGNKALTFLITVSFLAASFAATGSLASALDDVVVGGWDVCLMPFALNEATRYISPTKTLEYMAAGRPVVSLTLAINYALAEPEGYIRTRSAAGVSAARRSTIGEWRPVMRASSIPAQAMRM